MIRFSRIVAVLGVLFLAGFFLPWISGAENATGFEFAKGWWEKESTKVLGIVLFLAPVGALLAVLMGALGRAHGLIAFFTGLICPVLVVMFYLGAEPGQAAVMGEALSYGFWMAISASLGLLIFSFTKSDSKRRAR
jgi:amino acid permease